MSAITTGGNFKCQHNIDTDDVSLWNDHCSDPENGHFEQGTTQCVGCGAQLSFTNVPFHRIDKSGSKNIQLRCDECEESLRESFKNRTITKLVEGNPAQ